MEGQPTVGGSMVVTIGGGSSEHRRPLSRMSEIATRPIEASSKAIISRVNWKWSVNRLIFRRLEGEYYEG